MNTSIENHENLSDRSEVDSWPSVRSSQSVDHLANIEDPRQKINKFPDLVYNFRKRTGCCSNNLRKITLKTHPTYGRTIYISSKKQDQQKDKNIIPFTLFDPIIFMDMNKGLIDIERTDHSTVRLQSDNPQLVNVFYSEILVHRNTVKQLKDMLWKWYDCYSSGAIRSVNYAQNKQTADITLRKNTLRYVKHINKMSRHFITTALRYLLNHLQNGPAGYKKLLHFFFNKWYKEYNKNCIKESIKQNHENVRRVTQLFKDFSSNSNMSLFKHNPGHDKTKKISDHVSQIDKELNNIVSNIQNVTYCSNDNAQLDFEESEKITIVKNLQHLAELRHHLQTINNEEEEFILVGDQSSGKSSLLCMLLGVNIGYTSEHFATRCPVRYVLEPCPPNQGWCYQFENPQTKEFETVTQDELQRKLTTHFEKVIGRQIVYNPITIKIWSPICTSCMTLVDLPGLVGKGTDKVKQQQHSKSYHIVEEYLGKPNNIVLFVQRVDLDHGSMNTTILDKVQQRTPDKVVYCLTHFDRLCSDKDVRLEEIMRIINVSSNDIACNRDMFLLSLSKRVEDLTEKETITHDIIEQLQSTYPENFRRKNIHFNIGSLKKFLRKNIHKHVNQIEGVVYQFIQQQREYLLEQTSFINRSLVEPIINDVVLEQFIEIFRKKTIKLLKGQFLPERSSYEQYFFETLQDEVFNANKFAVTNNVPVWPQNTMKKRVNKKSQENKEQTNTNQDSQPDLLDMESASQTGDTEPVLVFDDTNEKNKFETDSNISSNTHNTMKSTKLSIISELSENEDYNSYYGENMDSSLQRDLVSHALFTRTIYELQLRLWSVFLSPKYQDIIYAIATDPNINLDGPKDAIYCVMTHTIKQQLSMNNFFNYAMKRLEYVMYKIIRYVIWFIKNSPDTPKECLLLLTRPEFQAILEIEVHSYCNELSNNTYKELTTIFDEIMSAPIVVSHALRYKEMLIQNFGWEEQDIIACTNDEIFKPRPVDIEKDTKKYNEDIEEERAKHIQNLITLHIHVRLIMITEHMIRAIDYNWRRMLDDSKETTFIHEQNNLFNHIKNNVLKSVNINGFAYKGEYLYKLYSGDEQTKLEEEKTCIDEVLNSLDNILATCELLPNLMTTSMKIAGDKFL